MKDFVHAQFAAVAKGTLAPDDFLPTIEAEAAKLEGTLGKINFQGLICMTIPVYNIIAAMQGLPVIPLPAFCTTPPAPVPPKS